MYEEGWQMSPRENRAEQIAEDRQLRDTRLNLRVTSAQAVLIRRAADSSEKSLTEFVLEGAAIAAERVLADRRGFALDSAAWKAFQTALERPVVLKPRLQVLLGETDIFVD